MKRQLAPIPARFELWDVVTKFIEDNRLGLSGNTERSYTYHLGSMRAFLLDHSVTYLDEVTPEALRGWLLFESNRQYARKGGKTRTISAGTVRHHYDFANAFFNWAVEQEHVLTNPFKKVRSPKLPQPTRVGFEKTELLRLMRQTETGAGWLAQRDKAIVVLLIGTGARADELITLEEDSFDWPRNRVLLHGKGAKDRYVTLGRTASKAVRDYLHARPKGASSFWVTARKTPMEYGALYMMLGNLGKYCTPPIANVTPHRFRHTYASEFYREHKDLLALRNLLGHTKIEVTERYLRSLGVEYGTTSYSSPDDWLK